MGRPALWILVAIFLLIVLPGPWGAITFIVLLLVGLVEILIWQRTVRGLRHAVGAETLIGEEAIVTSACHPDGQVRLDGETWQARCVEGAEVGEAVRITGRSQLTLVVEKRGELPA